MNADVSEAGATARELVYWAAARLEQAGVYFGHGTDNALDESVYLVFHALQLPFDAPDEALDQPLSAHERARAVDLIRRRIETRRPAAYLTGEAWFAGLPFQVDERVLVPRSPIAELIDEGFAPWVDPTGVRRILDIGTGSGCIAITCALAFPGAVVDAVDISADALEVAAANMARYRVGERVRLLRSDLFEAVPAERYDVIVANPPYVDRPEMEALPEEYRYEPEIGLAAGEDGLDVAERILREAAGHLNAHGVLVVEVGASQPALEARYPQVPFCWLEFERGGEGVLLLEASELSRFFGS